MRIAVVASPVAPLRPAQTGGAQSLICDLAVGLIRRGHKVLLHCAEGSEVAGVELVMVPIPSDANQALVMPGGAPTIPTPGVTAAITAMFRGIEASRPDVVSQHAFDAPAFEMAARLPSLHTLHLPPIEPAVVAAARLIPPARLATVSHSCRRDWEAAGVRIGRVIRNGVSDSSVNGNPVEDVALIAGRISPEKGVDHALTAARLAGARCRIAGSLYDPDYVVDLAGAEILGSIPRDELRRVMGRSAVTVCAIRWEEPFGLVAAEAQMAGCPVAAYRRGAMPEVVEEGVSGFMATPDDIHDLARAIVNCRTLDRRTVKASAQRRLGLEGMLNGYEAALREVAR
ncbi:MAG: glycosyltransferase [Candidatus Dormibacteraeota bacterium]|nr:glycosyltransferase [Candidatus Dormibacteraeota bacterium]